MMPTDQRRPLEIDDENAALRLIVEGTATESGDRFFEALVKNLAIVLNTRAAWVSEYVKPKKRLRALALWGDVEGQMPVDIPIEDSPCEKVIANASLIHYPQNIRALFPKNI